MKWVSHSARRWCGGGYAGIGRAVYARSGVPRSKGDAPCIRLPATRMVSGLARELFADRLGDEVLQLAPLLGAQDPDAPMEPTRDAHSHPGAQLGPPSVRWARAHAGAVYRRQPG